MKTVLILIIAGGMNIINLYLSNNFRNPVAGLSSEQINLV